MRTLSKWLIRTFLALLLALIVALALAVDGAPRVAPPDAVSPADVDRAVTLARLHDPRLVPPGQLRAVELSERDVGLLVDQAAQRWLPALTRVRLEPGAMRLQASIAAPLGRWLNLDIGLRQTASLPELDHLRVGHLPVPAALVMPLLRALAERRGVDVDQLFAVDWIERVTLAAGRLSVSYRISADTLGRLRAALATPGSEQRLRAYAERLAAVTQRSAGDRVSVAALLQPLFALAGERSAAGADAVEENRAALLVLTLYANHRPPDTIVASAASWPAPRPLVLTLRQRDDSALHFLISAVIAAQAGTPLADAVGVWKELADARAGGSGFSFNDLAADRAGARVGERAVRDAGQLQARFAAGPPESDFMPNAADLPESMPEAAFVARYGGIGAAPYNRMLAEIEKRVAALPVLR